MSRDSASQLFGVVTNRTLSADDDQYKQCVDDDLRDQHLKMVTWPNGQQADEVPVTVALLWPSAYLSYLLRQQKAVPFTKLNKKSVCMHLQI